MTGKSGLLLRRRPPSLLGHLVPDLRFAAPNVCIDPTGVRDSTAGLQAWLDAPARPEGTSTNRTTILFPAGATYRVDGGLRMSKDWTTWRSTAGTRALLFQQENFPYRVRPAATNPLGDISKSWYELTGSIARTGWDGTCAGATLSRTDGVFVSGQIGKQIEIWYLNEGSPTFGKWFSQLFAITGITNAGKTVTLNGTPHATWDEDGARPGQDRFWAVLPKGDWERVFTPNPSYNLKSYTGNTANGTAAVRAQAGVGTQARLRPDFVYSFGADHCQLRNMRIRSSNTTWVPYNDNRGQSDPIEAENFPAVVVPSATHDNELDNVDIYEVWGTGLSIDGTHQWVHDSRIYRCGRQCMDTGRSYACVMEDCVLHSSRHSLIDFEPNNAVFLPGATFAIDWWVVQRCIFGEGAGGAGQVSIAASSAWAVSHIRFEDNQSLNSDVGAGTIPAVAAFDMGGNFGPPTKLSPPSGHYIWRGNKTDKPIGAWFFRRVNNVLFENNDRQSKVSNAGALRVVGVTNYMSRGNTVNGVLDTTQYYAGTPILSFVEPGTAGGDWWWAANAPDPTIIGRP